GLSYEPGGRAIDRPALFIVSRRQCAGRPEPAEGSFPTMSAFDPAAFQAALNTRTIGRFLLYRPSIDTTMRLARREADEGAPDGTLVLAEEQTAGRGRRGRGFFSPPGENLYFTLLLRRPAPVHGALPVAVPVAVCEAVRAEGLDARIKWPNDIW